MRIFWVSLLLLAVTGAGCFRVEVSSTAGKAGGSTQQAAQNRWSVVEKAVGVTIAGMKSESGRFKQLHGDQARSGDFLSHSVTHLRTFDWSGVATDGPSGAVEPMLELARRQEAKLREAGFLPIASHARGVGATGGEDRATAHVSANHQHRWGGTSSSGSDGYSVRVGAPRIVYWRLYSVPDAGATLSVRMEYDRSTSELLVEFSYNDRTVLNARYPGGSATLREKVDR